MNGSSRVRRRVLLVEDNLVLAGTVADLLRHEGVLDVAVVHDGRVVISWVTTFAPDVVVLDVALGEVNGAIVSRELRNLWPKLPIILSTGNVETAEVRSALSDLGITALQKPYAIDTLLRAIAAVRPERISRTNDLRCPRVSASHSSVLFQQIAYSPGSASGSVTVTNSAVRLIRRHRRARPATTP
jgi:DNA-binding response OmpR family regulator